MIEDAKIEETKISPFTEISYVLSLDDGVDYGRLFLARTALASGWFAGTGVLVSFNGKEMSYESWTDFIGTHISGDA